ncbi:unnamed protein product [Adineta steineri]|uniref:Uncharacterized protein n=1 Tax=Adineta steineri TaxID=433720 RepID=A0A814R0I0_9BILA|nr:unnamed protein product [Adineta steineri]CAF1126270.1 unnamed protein product [Adineta steineri]
MDATGYATKSIVPSFIVQEEGSYKVFIYLNIPELKVKRSFRNFLKYIPSNGHVKVLDFQNHVQTKLYSISIAPLPGKIQPARCSIKYQRVGCLITLIKLHSTPWMNRIWDNHSHGLNIQENNDYSLLPPAPPKKVILKDTGIPPPLNLVPVVSSLSSRSTMKKKRAPPPPPPLPLNLVPVVSSLSSQSTMKKRPAPAPAPAPPPLPLNLVHVRSSSSSQSIIKKRPAPPPPTNSRASSTLIMTLKTKIEYLHMCIRQ